MTWKRSTKCGTSACVEVAWRKSSYSMDNGNCVEVATTDRVLVRDSKQDAGPVLTFGTKDWSAFLAWCVR